MKKILFIISILALSLNLYAKNVYDYYSDGLDKYKVEDYKGALECFMKCIKMKPEFAKSYNEAGLSYAAMNNFDQAILMYKEALIADKDYAEAYYNRAVAYEMTKKPLMAEKDYAQAISLNNDTHIFVRASLNLAMLDRLNGEKTKNKEKFDDAISLIRKASVYEPDFAELYNEAGLVYLDTELYDQAAEQFQKAIEKDQHYVEASTNLAIAYEKKGNLARAMNQSESAVKLNENFPGAQYNYGNLCILDGYYDKAIAHLTKATELNPKFAEAYYSLGKAYLHKNMFKEAEDSYKKALKINKTFTLAKRALADMQKLKKELKSHIKVKPTPSTEGAEGETASKDEEKKTDENTDATKSDDNSNKDNEGQVKESGDAQQNDNNGEEGQTKPKEEGWE